MPLIKNVMHSQPGSIDNELRSVFSECGVKFHIVKHFKGAPVQGFIEKAKSEQMMLCMTIRQAWADVFWFTLFQEIGHILNDDVKIRFVDYDFTDTEEEILADRFAQDTLLNPDIYEEFIKTGNFSIEAIKELAKRENIKPYIIIGRMQKEKHIQYQTYSAEKDRYKWAK